MLVKYLSMRDVPFHHLINNDTKTPDIRFDIVGNTMCDFGGHPIDGALQGGAVGAGAATEEGCKSYIG